VVGPLGAVGCRGGVRVVADVHGHTDDDPVVSVPTTGLRVGAPTTGLGVGAPTTGPRVGARSGLGVGIQGLSVSVP